MGRTSALVATSVVVALGGCGDEGAAAPSQAEYQRVVKAAVAEVQRDRDVPEGLPGLEQALRLIDRFVADLRDAAPPSEISEAHTTLVDALADRADITRAALAAFKRGDEAEARRLGEKNLPKAQIEAAGEARRTLRREGYDVFPAAPGAGP